MTLDLGLLGMASVLAGMLVGSLGPGLRRWLDSRSVLNEAKAEALRHGTSPGGWP